MNKQILRNTIFVGLFLIPLVPFLVSPVFLFPFITTKAFAWRIIVEIIFAVWLVLVLLDVEYRPKRSLILYSIFGFLTVIGLADLFGVAPIKSFWSNFERMEGFITLLHLGMFFLVISSVFKELDWKRWWNTSLVASFLMVLYCALQLLGLKTINQGGVRVDGTLGNAIYLAVYMLFHIFIALFFMWRERKNTALRWIYGLLILMQVSILYLTATRGAILGLIGGVIVMSILNIANKEDKLARKVSIGVLVGLVALIGGFFVIKDTGFVKNSLVLSRFSSLNVEEIKTQGRYFVWPMAIEGIKERPILGWGQENFNYVFQKHYSPDMFRLEPWFDRAHNIFLDWTIAGGIFGLLSYLVLYVALLFLIWKPILPLEENKASNFSHVEKSVLTGLVLAYFFHNIFVFDHLISYILFFSLLAYVHSRQSGKTFLDKQLVTEFQVTAFVLPVVFVLLILSIYYVNVKPIYTNTNIINGLKSVQTPGRMNDATQYFIKAYNTSWLGRSEVVEQMTTNSLNIFRSDISIEDKNNFFEFVNEKLMNQTKVYKDDSRYEILAGSFLSSVGKLDEALINLNRAQELIPNKQIVYFEIGAVYINKNEPQKALENFKKAYELATENLEAKAIYLIGAIYAKDRQVENEMLNKLTENEIVFDDRIVSAYQANGRIDKVKSLLRDRIRLDPENAEKYEDMLKNIAN